MGAGAARALLPHRDAHAAAAEPAHARRAGAARVRPADRRRRSPAVRPERPVRLSAARLPVRALCLARRARRRAAQRDGPRPSTTTSPPVSPAQQSARFLTYAIAATALLLGAIAVGSPGAIDVGYASSAGATLLLHGTLPYGHMPTDVVHGDTYPLLNYIAYIPAAAVSPVRDAFDDTSGAVLVALAAALLVAATLRRSGPRMVLAWLCFPPVAIAVAAGTNDLLLAAAVAGALTLASRPGRSSLALAAGAWIKLAPLALLPVWLARTRGRPLLRSASAVCGLSALLGAWLLVMGGPTRAGEDGRRGRLPARPRHAPVGVGAARREHARACVSGRDRRGRGLGGVERPPAGGRTRATRRRERARSSPPFSWGRPTGPTSTRSGCSRPSRSRCSPSSRHAGSTWSGAARRGRAGRRTRTRRRPAGRWPRRAA